MSSPHALIIRRVRIEVRENWCQTSSFHSHPETVTFSFFFYPTKWHSDYCSQSEVPRLHMHRRDIFCIQSNQASPSCGNAHISVQTEASGVNPPPSQQEVLEEVQSRDGRRAVPLIIQQQLFRTHSCFETQSFQGILALLPQHTFTVCVLIDFIGGVRWAGSVLSGSCNAGEINGRGEMCLWAGSLL